MSQQTTFKIPKTNSLVAVSTYMVLRISTLVYGVMTIEATLWSKVIIPLAGAIFFTFIEYVAHRYLYHSGEDYIIFLAICGSTICCTTIMTTRLLVLPRPYEIWFLIPCRLKKHCTEKSVRANALFYFIL